ncbi:MAG TPA: hypothetical protein VGS22_16515 [Thermoanaerobaculia bacterium]|jgi:hypothetical protein|nr:hypothetical protein [Thermoanaerobaculia bacterium]
MAIVVKCSPEVAKLGRGNSGVRRRTYTDGNGERRTVDFPLAGVELDETEVPAEIAADPHLVVVSATTVDLFSNVAKAIVEGAKALRSKPKANLRARPKASLSAKPKA